MILKAIGYFLARWDMSKALAIAIEENIELGEKNGNLADLACEQRSETFDFRKKLNKMHRRAQRAEAKCLRIANEAIQPYAEENAQLRKAVTNARYDFDMAVENLRKVYPLLHQAWLHKAGSKSERDEREANQIADLEAHLRREYRGIEEPPKPELFSKGDSE